MESESPKFMAAAVDRAACRSVVCDLLRLRLEVQPSLLAIYFATCSKRLPLYYAPRPSQRLKGQSQALARASRSPLAVQRASELSAKTFPTRLRVGPLNPQLEVRRTYLRG